MENYWRNVKRSFSFLCVFALFTLVGLGTLSAESAESALARGAFDEAREKAFSRDDASSLRVRSLFALWSGDQEGARRFLEAAMQARGPEGELRKSAVALARLDWIEGRRDEAVASLRELLRDAPQDLEVRFELGAFLVDDGKVEEGRGILLGSARRFNDGLITAPEELVWLGRAMMVGNRPRDANRALSRALAADETHLEANLRLGELMWSRNNTGEALESLERVIAQSEDHPEALALLAEIDFTRTGRFPEAMERLSRAEERFPWHPVVLRTKAKLLVIQGEWEEGLATSERLLGRFPQDGEGLALKAAAAFLLAMDERFQEAINVYDERRSGTSQLLTTLGEMVALNRRNEVAIQFFRQALERRDDDAKALSGLGFALTRIGQETEGIGYLERSFRLDGFNVRVYNTLELYERGLRDYITEDVDGFRLRAHMDHFELIRSLSEPLVKEAFEEMGNRYGIELSDFTLEVYAEREAFAVRTVGLPNIDPHGICFGPVVLTRSPAEGNFNWAMVLWHEIAHSFHLELSEQGVARWFTEGLAEYETYLKDPAWTRFYDVDLARMVQKNQIWSIGELDQVFMTGRGMEVVYAYQLAMLVMAFLDDVHGFEKIIEMLKAYRREGRTNQVFSEVLGISLEEIDQQFQEWLRERYRPLMSHTLVDTRRLRALQRGEEVDHETRAEASVFRALVSLSRGNLEQARAHVDNALRRGPEEPEVLLLATFVFDGLDAVSEGLETGRKALDLGVESFELRILLSRLATRAERHEEAYVHALAAAMNYPNSPEGWRMVATKARQVGEDLLANRAEFELFKRETHSAPLAMQMARVFQERGETSKWLLAARRWTEIAALDAQAQIALAEAALENSQLSLAARAYRQAALASPGRRVDILTEGATRLRGAGDESLAQELEGVR